MFIWQVVVILDGDPVDLAKFGLSFKSNGGSAQAVIENRLPGAKRLEVFGEDGGREEVSGQSVYTGLLMVAPRSQLYKKMPLKFEEATLIGAPDVKLEQLKVYLNFMSHHVFEERASYSGPVKITE